MGTNLFTISVKGELINMHGRNLRIQEMRLYNKVGSSTPVGMCVSAVPTSLDGGKVIGDVLYRIEGTPEDTMEDCKTFVLEFARLVTAGYVLVEVDMKNIGKEQGGAYLAPRASDDPLLAKLTELEGRVTALEEHEPSEYEAAMVVETASRRKKKG